MSLRDDDDELALPDDLLAVEALLVAVRDVERTPDMAARARALGEADEVQAIGTPVESAIGTRVEAPAATTAAKPRPGALESEKSTPRPGRASARRSGASGEVGRLRSKVALLQLAGVLGGVVLLLGGWQWARFAAAPAPPPPRVIDHAATLKAAQQRAQDGYRKASQARLLASRSDARRLFDEALADLDAAQAIYEELFEEYAGEGYEYLGPEFDRISQTKMAIRKELMALAPDPAEHYASLLGSVEATLSNQPDRARLDVRGRVADRVPNGAVLTVSLRVRDVTPIVELAFFQVEVRDGSFAGAREWSGPTLAPMGYRAVVTLSFRSQSPLVRKFLAKELGGEEVERFLTIATQDVDVGTPEEQARFLAATRRELREHVEVALRLHARLGRRLEGPMDNAWAAWSVAHDQAMRFARDALGDVAERHVASPEGRALRDLQEAHASMVRSYGARALKEGDPRPDWEAAGDALRRLRAALAPLDEVPPAPEAADADGLLRLGLEALGQHDWRRAHDLFLAVELSPDCAPAHEERLRAAVVDAARRERLVGQAERALLSGRDDTALASYRCMRLLRAWLPLDDPLWPACNDLLGELARRLQDPSTPR